MLEKLLELYGIYGDEEKSFDCSEVFRYILSNLEDDEEDIRVIMKFLLETSDFGQWIDDTYHSIDDCDEDCENCDRYNNDKYNDECEDYEQTDIFNAQAELLKNTQEELKALKRKYNKLLRKYKGLSN